METIAVVSPLASFPASPNSIYPHLSSMLHTSNQPSFIVIILDHSCLHIPLLLTALAHICLQTTQLIFRSLMGPTINQPKAPSTCSQQNT